VTKKNSLIQPENKGGKGEFLRIQSFEYYTETMQKCSSKCRERGCCKCEVQCYASCVLWLDEKMHAHEQECVSCFNSSEFGIDENQSLEY
jgi:hypothetical protein